jgi:hypothetical protein
MATEQKEIIMRLEHEAGTRTHQRGQSVFRSVLPEDIEWKPFAAFPSSVRLAVIVGEPSAPSPYVIRVKVPSGVKLMPHRHPEDRIYTVISGVFYIGLGEKFRRGSVIRLSTWQCDRSARRYLSPPLCKIRRVRYPSDGNWSACPGIYELKRRSQKQQQ